MYPLSTFVTLFSGGEICTNNFIPGVDYKVEDKSLYVILSSERWDCIEKVNTSPVSALDYISADSQVLTSLAVFNMTNQPFLTAEQDYYYHLTDLAWVSAVGLKGRNFIIYPGTNSAYYRHSGSGIAGNVVIKDNDITNLILTNCSVSGIILPTNRPLSALGGFSNEKTWLDPQNFSSLIEHLCTYGKNYINFFQKYDAGFNGGDGETGFNPFKHLTPSAGTAWHHLTAEKSCSYYYTSPPPPPPPAKNNALIADSNIAGTNGTYTLISLTAPVGSDTTRGYWRNNSSGSKLFFNSNTDVWFISGSVVDYFGLENVNNPWSVTTWVPDTGGTTPTVTEIT